MAVEEVLYSAMEDFYIDIMIGSGETSRSVHLDLPPFTLIGATTRAALSNPLRARFGITGHMEYYEAGDLTEIVERTAEIFEMDITHEAAKELALRSRGTPRIANRLLKRVRDYAQIMGNGLIDDKITDQALSMLDVDQEGLDYVDQKILKTMIEVYGGGPVGLGTLSVNIAEERETVEDMYEPYLIQKGFVMRTRTGRVATRKAYEHLGYEYMNDDRKGDFRPTRSRSRHPSDFGNYSQSGAQGFLVSGWLCEEFYLESIVRATSFDSDTDVDVIFFNPSYSEAETIELEAKLKADWPQYRWELRNQAYMHPP